MSADVPQVAMFRAVTVVDADRFRVGVKESRGNGSSLLYLLAFQKALSSGPEMA